jgi:hypothetical protein
MSNGKHRRLSLVAQLRAKRQRDRIAVERTIARTRETVALARLVVAMRKEAQQ